MRIADALLPEFDHEMPNTRKMLERIPQEKWDWRPHPKSFTTRELATHIATIPAWMVDTIEKDSYDFAPVGGQPYQPPAAFDKGVAGARAALAAAEDGHLMKDWALLAGGQVIFSMPRVACIRSFVMNHNVHHRGQLSVYLRLCDVAVPGMYGPSADETGM
jgi:DinB family